MEGVLDGRFLSPRALDRDIYTYIGQWSELRPWLNGRYPQVVVERPGDHCMPAIEFIFLLDIVIPGPLSSCFPLISYLSPIFENNRQDLWLRMNWLKLPIRRIRYSYLFHFYIYDTKYWRKTCMGHILLLIELNKFRLWE